MKSANSIEIYWVAMPVMRNLIMLAAKSEHEIQIICRAANILPADLDKVDMRISLAGNIAIMEAMYQLTNDENMGLYLGERSTPPIIGQAGYLQLSSKDVLTAFKSTIYYYKTFTRLYEFRFSESEELIQFFFEPIALWNEISPQTARQGTDIPFAATLNFTKVLCGRKVYPLKVQYRYPPLRDTTEHERIFKCRPLFDQPHNCIVFNKRSLEIPILGYNPQLNAAIEVLLRERMGLDGGDNTFSEQVKSRMLESYQYGFPELEDIAVSLNTTARTLQRKLQEEGLTFRGLEDAMKAEIACRLLKDRSIPLKEIANKLGYADRSSFQRAFKQWTGVTPGQYK